MKNNLPPLDLTEDNKKFEAYNETKEVNFKKCSHSQVKYENDELRCACGAGWRGSRIGELYEMLTKNSK